MHNDDEDEGPPADPEDTVHARKKRRGEEWKIHSAMMREQLMVSSGFAPWTSKPSTRLLGVPRNERYLDVIDMAWAFRLSKMSQSGLSEDEMKVGYFVDIHTAVQRCPWGPAKTLTQGMPHVWSRARSAKSST